MSYAEIAVSNFLVAPIVDHAAHQAQPRRSSGIQLSVSEDLSYAADVQTHVSGRRMDMKFAVPTWP